MMRKLRLPALTAALLVAPLLMAQAPVIDREQRPQQRQSQSAAQQQGGGGDSSGMVAELYNQMQQLQQEMMLLRGIVEEQGNELRRLQQQTMERYIDLDRRIGELDGSAPVEDGAAASAATGGDDELQAYRGAYELLRERKFGEATEAFQAFVDQYPEGSYAANAWYWLGELHLVEEPRDLDASGSAFQRVVENHPDSDKVADSLYKLGTVHFMKGEEERARQRMEQVIKDHGGSSAAELAQRFLRDNF